MTSAAMIALENDDSITHSKIGTGHDVDDGAYTLVTQVRGIIVKFKIMGRPNT
jgi:hypothetical protein